MRAGTGGVMLATEQERRKREYEREEGVGEAAGSTGGVYLAVDRQPHAVGPVVHHNLRHLRGHFVCKGQQSSKKPFPRSALDEKKEKLDLLSCGAQQSKSGWSIESRIGVALSGSTKEPMHEQTRGALHVARAR